MDSQVTCPNCKWSVSSSDFFCPVCGKNLKEKLLSTSLTRQLLIYLLSVFLPPFGIWPAIKYLRQSDDKSKKIGLAAIFLTVISIVITIWLTAGFINSFSKGFSSQLNLFEGIGYWSSELKSAEAKTNKLSISGLIAHGFSRWRTEERAKSPLGGEN